MPRELHRVASQLRAVRPEKGLVKQSVVNSGPQACLTRGAVLPRSEKFPNYFTGEYTKECMDNIQTEWIHEGLDGQYMDRKEHRSLSQACE